VFGVLEPHVGHADTRGSFVGFPTRKGSHVEHEERRSAYAECSRVLEPHVADLGITP